MNSLLENKNVVTRTIRPGFRATCLESCRRFLARMRHAKARVLREFRGSVEEHGHLLKLAVNEAETLAWQTGFPQLFFPTLALEKAQSVAHWHERQRFVRQGNLQGRVTV